MDEFLIPNANFMRLYEEYKRYGSLSIGVDFDNTIYDYHKKGYGYETVIDLCIRAVELGMKVHIFTANPDHALVTQYCAEKGIQIEGINTCGVKLGWESRKPFYSLLLDDRAGLISAVDDLERLVQVLEQELLIKFADDQEINFSES
jgi:hypothetical protein